MCDLVARTGRHQQRYDAGCRLVAGCIPFRYRDSVQSGDANTEKIIEVLMINSTSGPGLLFPKGELPEENFKEFSSQPCMRQRTLGGLGHSPSPSWRWYSEVTNGGWENDETVQEAAVREAIEEAGVRGELMGVEEGKWRWMVFPLLCMRRKRMERGNVVSFGKESGNREGDFLGYYHFKSKTHQDEFCPEGLCKAAMFALFVKEELQSWPEQSTRNRTWLTIPEAEDRCRHAWMRDALENGFSKWHAGKDL
uniref:Nudix hydrolase domain-containing protein n=1 Tax=Fagus sylvatica TaxID=28930 RepID=A0A2N9HZY3_FAGSY